MALHKSRAFVLGSADYRETSKLLHLFCENEGRISLVAKGMRSSKSKRATSAEPFSLVQLTYSLKDGATLGLLTGIEPERTFPGIRTKLESYALASYWFEVVKVAGQARLASPEFFNLTQSFLETFSLPGPMQELTPWHFGRFLQALGFGADFQACANCESSERLNQFDPLHGAVICNGCVEYGQRYLVLTADKRLLFSRLFGAQPPLDGSALTMEQMLPFFQLLNELLTHHLDHPLKTFAFVKDTMKSLR